MHARSAVIHHGMVMSLSPVSTDVASIVSSTEGHTCCCLAIGEERVGRQTAGTGLEPYIYKHWPNTLLTNSIIYLYFSPKAITTPRYMSGISGLATIPANREINVDPG